MKYEEAAVPTGLPPICTQTPTRPIFPCPDTARRWVSLLKTSFIVFLLFPHHRNFNKRVGKSPQLYFHDTGMLCQLLGIRDAAQIVSHKSVVVTLCLQSGYSPELFQGVSKRLIVAVQGFHSDFDFSGVIRGNRCPQLADRSIKLGTCRLERSLFVLEPRREDDFV